MRTREVAQQAGVNVQTLRCYERRRLLAEPPRRASGYRVYGAEAVRVVRFIKRAQQLGFSLDAVQTLLELAASGPEDCEAAQEMARQQIVELDRRVADLQAMRVSLQRLVEPCRSAPDVQAFPLTHAFDSTCGDPSGPARAGRH